MAAGQSRFQFRLPWKNMLRRLDGVVWHRGEAEVTGRGADIAGCREGGGECSKKAHLDSIIIFT